MDRPAAPTRALSVRQPWAELILRGLKTAEYRSRPTQIVGERFYLYAARTPGPADALALLGPDAARLPTGVIVGVATIRGCRRVDDPGDEAAFGATPGAWAWDLARVERLPVALRPDRHPQPTWFRPFDPARPAARPREAA